MPPLGNGKQFIKDDIEASRKRMKKNSGRWEDGTVEITPLIDHAEVQDRVLIHLLDEFSEFKEILKKFVDQERFKIWAWKIISSIVILLGGLASIFMIIQIQRCIHE
jgi:hypothetical protein